jgi:hypothetical protein
MAASVIQGEHANVCGCLVSGAALHLGWRPADARALDEVGSHSSPTPESREQREGLQATDATDRHRVPSPSSRQSYMKILVTFPSCAGRARVTPAEINTCASVPAPWACYRYPGWGWVWISAGRRRLLGLSTDGFGSTN